MRHINWIAELEYYKVTREISNLQQIAVKEARKMYLYKERITTKYRKFRLEEVLDITYKEIGKGEGMLYLHTNQGVFPFMVAVDPEPFIEKYCTITKDL